MQQIAVCELFDLANVAYTHLSFHDIRYSPYASQLLSVFVADVKFGLCEINKKTTEQMLHVD